MREWSFSPDEGPALFDNPSDFAPVLNLEAFAEMLKRSQFEAYSAPVIARGAALLVVE